MHGESGNGNSKRDKILAAAYAVFSRKGFHGATIDEIIALADTGKGTVYNYFANKEKLFYTLITERSRPFQEAVTEVVNSEKDPMDKIKEVIKLFLQFYDENGDLWRVMMHEMRGLSDDVSSNLTEAQRDKYQLWFKDTIVLLEKVLQEGIDKQVFRVCDVTKAAYGLFSVIVVMVFHNLVKEGIEQTAEQITDIFLYGIATK